MARQLPERPNTDQIADADGVLTDEWAKRLDDAFLYFKELQAADGEQITTEQIQTMIDVAVDTAVAALPVVTYYEETFSPSGGFKAVTHNLGTETPLWSVSQDINSTVIFALDIGDENTSYLNFNANPSQPITITMARIVMPET